MLLIFFFMHPCSDDYAMCFNYKIVLYVKKNLIWRKKITQNRIREKKKKETSEEKKISVIS